MAFLQYLLILISALIGLYAGSLILPGYDEILYPFAPNFSFRMEFYMRLTPLGFLSMLAALTTTWVYKKTVSLAAISSLVAISLDYRFSLFSNLSEHHFHLSFIVVYAFGMYMAYLTIKALLSMLQLKRKKL